MSDLIRLLTPVEVAAKLQVPISWVHDHTKRTDPKIPHIKLGHHVRFREDEVEKFIEELRRM